MKFKALYQAGWLARCFSHIVFTFILKLFCLKLFWMTKGSQLYRLNKIWEPQLKFNANLIIQYISGGFFPEWLNSFEILRSFTQLASYIFLFPTFFPTINLCYTSQLHIFVLISKLYCIITPTVYLHTCLANYSKASYAIDIQMVISSRQIWNIVVCHLGAKSLQLPTLASQLNFKMASFEISS